MNWRPPLVALALVALVTAGCTLDPGRYDGFDPWLVGEPDEDYESFGAEYVPALRIFYGPLVAVPWVLRDGLRLLISPVVFVWDAIVPGKHVPTSAFVGPRREPPQTEDPQ